jgi:5-methylcytosine-specific restriction enzyme subunit McrC
LDILIVDEHDDINVPIDRLLSGGEIALDKRIEKRGYFNIALSSGRVRLTTTRFIGLIPLTENLAVRVVPKVTISNLGKMMVKAGNIPAFIEDFSRGYLPSFAASEKAIEIYHGVLIAAVTKLRRLGIMKSYASLDQPPPWRGRLLVSQTVKTQIARGVRYKKSFDFQTLSTNIAANQLLKLALTVVLEWLRKSTDNKVRRKIPGILAHLREFDGVSAPARRTAELAAKIPALARNLPVQYRYYSEAMWITYVILQGLIPDPTKTGYVSLDSMIVDVSAVFEGYIRKILQEHSAMLSCHVKDGNAPANQHPFFFDRQQENRVKPDIILERQGKVEAILDVKYKKSVNEHDRYELLSFMEVTGAKEGAFIVPLLESSGGSIRLGTTLGGRRMSLIAFDLAAPVIEDEEVKLVKAVSRLIQGELP